MNPAPTTATRPLPAAVMQLSSRSSGRAVPRTRPGRLSRELATFLPNGYRGFVLSLCRASARSEDRAVWPALATIRLPAPSGAGRDSAVEDRRDRPLGRRRRLVAGLARQRQRAELGEAVVAHDAAAAAAVAAGERRSARSSVVKLQRRRCDAGRHARCAVVGAHAAAIVSSVQGADDRRRLVRARPLSVGSTPSPRSTSWSSAGCRRLHPAREEGGEPVVLSLQRRLAADHRRRRRGVSSRARRPRSVAAAVGVAAGLRAGRAVPSNRNLDLRAGRRLAAVDRSRRRCGRRGPQAASACLPAVPVELSSSPPQPAEQGPRRAGTARRARGARRRRSRRGSYRGRGVLVEVALRRGRIAVS